MVTQTARIHERSIHERSILECFHMTAFLAAQGCRSIHDLPCGRFGPLKSNIRSLVGRAPPVA
jgi:hypothetical protein